MVVYNTCIKTSKKIKNPENVFPPTHLGSVHILYNADGVGGGFRFCYIVLYMVGGGGGFDFCYITLLTFLIYAIFNF